METVERHSMAGGYVRGVITLDEYPDSPREWDNLGTMVCAHRDYILGDVQADSAEGVTQELLALAGWIEDQYNEDGDLIEWTDEQREAALDRALVRLPLYLFDHSGLTMSTGTWTFRGFDPVGWDWGMVGWIAVSWDKARAEMGADVTREQIEAALEAEVEVYDQYLQGDVYGVDVWVKGGEHDLMFGCYGLDYARQVLRDEMRALVASEAAKLHEGVAV